METAKKANLFACAMLFIASMAAGYQLGAPNALRLDGSQPGAVAVLAVIIGLLLFGIWLLFDMIQATELGLEMTWPAGMVRWAACGLFTGLLYGTLQVRWIWFLSERNIVRSVYESIGSFVIFLLVFWLIFRRNFWTLPFLANRRSTKVFGNLLLLAGLILLAGGFLSAASIRSWTLLILLAVGLCFSGLGLVLAAVVVLFGERLAKRRRTSLASIGLIFTGVVFTLLSFLLP